jgi:proline-specific peptidase
MEFTIREGFIPFHGYRTWYHVVGDGEEAGKLPLLCLHGGPGMAHDYLEPLEAMAGTGRRVILYDQLGCGNSDHPHDPSLWNVDLFVQEVNAVRNSLALQEIHLLGQSWGGVLAQEYLLTKPDGVKSLILANSTASTKRWIAEANLLRAKLPEEIQQILQEHEDAGRLDNPAYLSATEIYYRRHLCRLMTWPDCLQRTLDQLNQDPEVYNTMWGPTEFYCTGRLQNWNIEDRLSEIHIPTLIISGEYDESTPAINEVLHRGIQNSEWIVFEGCSHTPHLEATEKYLDILNSFLTRIEVSSFSLPT